MRSSTTGKMPRSSSDRSAPSGHRQCRLEALFPSTRLGPHCAGLALGADGLLGGDTERSGWRSDAVEWLLSVPGCAPHLSESPRQFSAVRDGTCLLDNGA